MARRPQTETVTARDDESSRMTQPCRPRPDQGLRHSLPPRAWTFTASLGFLMKPELQPVGNTLEHISKIAKQVHDATELQQREEVLPVDFPIIADASSPRSVGYLVAGMRRHT